MAEAGVAWLPIAVELTREAEPDLRRHSGRIPFLPDCEMPAVGAELRLPGLAKVLKAFKDDGAALFHGRLGGAVVDRVAEGGGFLAREDLCAAEAEWSAPEALALAGGGLLFATPLPSHGPLLLLSLIHI